MINFGGKDKFAHCMDRIAAAGHYIRYVDNEIEVSDEAAVQAIIDAYTLDQAKAWKCAQVAALAKELRNQIIANVSPAEMSSWPIKLSEAAKFAATGNAADAPMLSAEASARNVTLAELIAKVNGNATVFSGFEAVIAGVDGKHRDAIKALTTFEAVASYNYSTGWPEV